MSHRVWDYVFLAGFVAYCAIRGVYEGRAKGVETATRRKDGLETALLVAVGVGCLLLPLAHVFTPWLDRADYVLPDAAPPIGVFVMVGALALFRRSHADLGTNWSVTLEIRKGHRLVTEGVYRRVRHPMYAAILLFGVAQALMLDNAVAGWSAFASFLVLYFVRTPREERMMLEAFGEEYREYMRRSGRLWPRSSARS